MEKEKTYVEKLQEFLDYNRAFEKKARELLFAPKRDNVAIKMWLINETDNYIGMHKELLKCLEDKKNEGTLLSFEAMMLHNRIQESMREVQHLIGLITLLPIQEEEMQK